MRRRGIGKSVLVAVQGAVLALGLLSGAWAAPGDQAKAGDKPRKDLALKGDARCTRCHDQDDDYPVLSIAQTRHGVRADERTPTCTSCHGQSDAHVDNPGGKADRPKPDRVFGKKTGTPVAELTGACATCHKGRARTHWEGSQHQVNDVTCANCHQIHAPTDRVLAKKTQPQVCFACHKEQRADSLKVSAHPIQAGKIACSDCHNPHGSGGQFSLKKNTINETCYTCHAEKRGPYLFEHLAAVENCDSCHTPHGSNLSPLMLSRSPFLCQSCHDGPHASESPAGRAAAGNQGGFVGTTPANGPSANLTGRGCLNCHSQIHGSNSPSGGYLQR